MSVDVEAAMLRFAVSDDDRIYPTNRCFDDAVELLALVYARAPLEFEKHTLVHAACLVPAAGDVEFVGDKAPGELFAHAWVEHLTPQGTIALQSGLWRGFQVVFGMPLSQLEAVLRPQSTWRYTAKQLLEDPILRETPGPWAPELRALSRPAVVS